MDPEEMQAVITELEMQRGIMASRAAEYARANYRLQKENTDLKKALESLKAAYDVQPQEINGEDRLPQAARFDG